MSMTFITKKDYLNQLENQCAVYQKFISAINLMEENLPDNGKGFNKRFFDKVNQELSEEKIAARQYSSNSDNGIALYFIGYDYVWDRSIAILPPFTPNKPAVKPFENGIMKDKEAVLSMLRNEKTRLAKTIERFDNARENVDKFMDKWKELKAVGDALREMKLPNITFPYINMCPIRE